MQGQILLPVRKPPIARGGDDARGGRVAPSPGLHPSLNIRLRRGDEFSAAWERLGAHNDRISPALARRAIKYVASAALGAIVASLPTALVAAAASIAAAIAIVLLKRKLTTFASLLGD
jgi:hypothetical protein